MCSLCNGKVYAHIPNDCTSLKWMNRRENNATSWEQILHWVIINERGKSRTSHTFEVTYAEACHAIRFERYRRIFEKNNRDSE